MREIDLFRLVIRTDSAQGTRSVGEAIGTLARPGDVVLLSGDLGAGKTQLVKGIAQALGVPEHVTSPTFNIMLVHEGRIPLYHVDLYRLEHADELEDIDYFDTLEADGIVAVEWGDRFPEAAPPDHLLVELNICGDAERELKVAAVGEKAAHLMAGLESAVRGLAGARIVGESA